jgi:DNA-binding IclR family transcriptional regulator
VIEQHNDRTTTGDARDERASVDKALSLLTVFGAEAYTGVGVSELARRARLSKSTAFRLLGVLERNGVIERVGSDYRLGQKLHELGARVYAPDHDRLREVLTPFLIDLYELTHETVHLAVLHGGDVVYLNKLYGHRPVRSPSRIGGRAPAYCTGVGKALLAYHHDAAERVLASQLKPLTPRTLSQTEALRSALATIRSEGIAFDDEEAFVGLSCVAVPVLGPSGRPVAALSVAGATGRLDTRSQAPALRRVSYAASRALARARAGIIVRTPMQAAS